MPSPETLSEVIDDYSALEELAKRCIEEYGLRVSERPLLLPSAYASLYFDRNGLPRRFTIDSDALPEERILGYFHCIMHLALGHTFLEKERQSPFIHFELPDYEAQPREFLYQEVITDTWTNRLINVCLSKKDQDVYEFLSDYLSAVKKLHRQERGTPFYTRNKSLIKGGTGMLYNFICQARTYFV